MKPSLNKALVLSLSVLVITASGCERRGRAPAKPATPTTPTSKTPTNTAPTNTGGTTTPTNGGTTSNNGGSTTTTTTPPGTLPTGPVLTIPTVVTLPIEAQLETDANMDCKAPAIVDGKISADEFVKDLKTMNDYLACMGASGLVLTCSDQTGKPCSAATLEENRSWVLDADPKKSKAFDEFTRIAQEKDDEVAFKTMNARLELSVIRLDKMGIKYNVDALKAAGVNANESLKFGQGDITIAATLSTIAKSKKALEDNRENIKAMKTVEDGVDSKDAVTLKAQSNAQRSN